METSQLLLLLLLMVSTWTETHSLKLPHYIQPCSQNDPQLNACAKQHAIQAIPQFINGDPKYKVPPLDPIVIEELSVTQGSANFGLSFLARKATLHGLKDVQVEDIRIDLQKQRIEYDLFFPLLDIRFRYNVTGKVLILPITGNGKGTLLLKDSSVKIAYDYDRVRKEADGKEYVVPRDTELNFGAQGMTIRLENLFNGDKFLGDNMNAFLNENWKDVLVDMGPAIGEAMGQVTKLILSNIFQLVPYGEAFPDKV